MPLPPQHVLRAVAPFVPDVLVGAAAQAATYELSTRLPPAFNWLGFECRLDDDPRVDFAGCTETWDGGREVLAAAVDNDPEFAGAGPAALIRNWANPASTLFRDCPAVWLEFDMHGRAILPFAFACLDPACSNTFRSRRKREPPPTTSQIIALASTSATLLAPGVDFAQALATVSQLVAALPPGGRALHMAVAPHRGDTDMRIHVSLPASELCRWLQKIHWPGDEQHVRQVLDLLANRFRQVGVQLAIGQQLRPYLGIEAYVNHQAGLCSWQQTVLGMCAARLARRDKANALLQWWGHHRVEMPSTRWKVQLDRQFYVKFVVAQGLRAKGYLAIFPSYCIG